MNRSLIFVLFVSSWFTAQAANLSQTRTRIDTWLVNRWPTITNRQALYLANNGRYWQGLITHSAVPAHTTTVTNNAAPDRWTFKPTDVDLNWADAFPGGWSNEAVSAAIKFDVYAGPQGQGWIGTIFVRFNGTLYDRAANWGPETWRTYGWRTTPLNIATNIP
jgi:hypothetical protein